MPSFACPKCKKVLKTSTPIPAGKKVKCPACATLFVMPALKEQLAVQANKPVAPPKPAPMASAAERTKPRRPDVDEEEAPRQSSRKAKAREQQEPNEDDEEEDRPKKRKKKKRKQEGNKNLILILGGAGALVLVLVVVLFIWPGLLTSGSNTVVAKGGPGAGQSKVPSAPDPFAYMPAKADILAGVDFTSLRRRPEFAQGFEQGIRATNQLNQDQIELLGNVDKAVLAITNAGPSGDFFWAITSATPFDSEKVRQAFKAGPAESVQGKTIHKISSGGMPGRELLAIPNNKVVVLGIASPEEFVKVLDGAGGVPSDMQTQVSAVSGKQIWAVVSLPAVFKDPNTFKGIAGLPGGAQAAPAMKNARFANLSLDFNQGLRLQLDIECANEQDASQVETFAMSLWEKQGKPSLGLASLVLAGKVPGDVVKKLTDEVTQNFQIQRQEAKVSASLNISEAAMKEAQNAQGGIPKGQLPKGKQRKKQPA